MVTDYRYYGYELQEGTNILSVVKNIKILRKGILSNA